MTLHWIDLKIQRLKEDISRFEKAGKVDSLSYRTFKDALANLEGTTPEIQESEISIQFRSGHYDNKPK